MTVRAPRHLAEALEGGCIRARNPAQALVCARAHSHLGFFVDAMWSCSVKSKLYAQRGHGGQLTSSPSPAGKHNESRSSSPAPSTSTASEMREGVS